MDTLTHALSGALLARATASSAANPNRLSTRARVVAGATAAAAPDLDFVIGFVGPIEYLLYHRGVTHSVFLLPAWAWLLAWLLAAIARDARGWRPWFGVCALSLAVHIAGDLITSFGTIVFAPFSNWRATLGTTFIIDLWFSGIIIIGLVASLVWRRTRVPATVASAVLAGYVVLQAQLKQEALEFGERYARAAKLEGVTVDALPRPVSPFNWTVFVSDERLHRFAHVNLRRRMPRVADPGDGLLRRLNSPYVPLNQAIWETRSRFGTTEQEQRVAREAWRSQPLAFFRWFADKPAFDGTTSGTACAWFLDLRFLTPGRDGVPFRYGVCRKGAQAPWEPYQRSGPTGALHPVRLRAR